MRIIVDRIEDDKAVVELESGATVTVPTEILCGAKEGDAVVLTVERKDSDNRVDTHSIFESLRKKSNTDA